jgi:hypothetical protein
MRFDLLDEYGTVVPFGLGVSKGNRVVRNPDIAGDVAEADAESRESKPMTLWATLTMMLRRTIGRNEYPVH